MDHTQSEMDQKDQVARLRDRGSLPAEQWRRLIPQFMPYLESEYTSVKYLTVGIILEGFQHVPDRQEDVVDAFYDMCEDIDVDARIIGYKTLAEVSRIQPAAWTGRNTDVLIQLLQNENRTELKVIKESLMSHITTGPEEALTVLCDHIHPNSECPPTSELRELVLQFLMDDARVACEPVFVSNSRAADIFAAGALQALAEASSHQSNVIFSHLIAPLFTLPSQSSLSDRTLTVILEKADASLSSLNREDFSIYLNLATCVTQTGSPPMHLNSAGLLFTYLVSRGSQRMADPTSYSDINMELIRRGVMLYELWTSSPFAESNAELFRVGSLKLGEQLESLKDNLIQTASSAEGWQILSKVLERIIIPVWKATNLLDANLPSLRNVLDSSNEMPPRLSTPVHKTITALVIPPRPTPTNDDPSDPPPPYPVSHPLRTKSQTASSGQGRKKKRRAEEQPIENLSFNEFATTRSLLERLSYHSSQYHSSSLAPSSAPSLLARLGSSESLPLVSGISPVNSPHKRPKLIDRVSSTGSHASAANASQSRGKSTGEKSPQAPTNSPSLLSRTSPLSPHDSTSDHVASRHIPPGALPFTIPPDQPLLRLSSVTSDTSISSTSTLADEPASNDLEEHDGAVMAKSSKQLSILGSSSRPQTQITPSNPDVPSVTNSSSSLTISSSISVQDMNATKLNLNIRGAASDGRPRPVTRIGAGPPPSNSIRVPSLSRQSSSTSANAGNAEPGLLQRMTSIRGAAKRSGSRVNHNDRRR